MKWSIQPLSRIFILFFAGNCIAEYIKFSILVYLLSFFFLGILLLFLNRSTLSNVLLSMFILLSGVINFKAQERNINEIPGAFHLVKVLSEPNYKNNKVIVDGHISGTFLNNNWKKNEGISRIEINLYSDSTIKIGDFLLINDSITIPTENILPKIFDYKKYLQIIGIDYFIKTDSKKILHLKNSEFSFYKFAIQAREKCINNIKQHAVNKDELAVISALILGAKSDLDKQLIVDYTQSGIVHILAVSGLHVGLLYVAFLFILSPFKRILPKTVFVILVVAFLWFYALIAGLSASVVRATFMCTFVIIASTYKLKITNFNLLASVAFFMVLYDSFVWKQLGFQLSFAAVWSIFAFKNIIDNGNKHKNWLIRNILKACSLSLVAQFSTTPICLYYFGTFPTYFLFANLVAVPLSTFLTYIGISAMLLSSIPYLGFCLSKTLEVGIHLMNSFAHFISELPFATIQHLHISEYTAICAVFLIFIISTLLSNFKFLKLKLKLTLFLLLLISVVQTTVKFNNYRNVSCIIFSKGTLTQAIVIKGNSFLVFNFWNSKKSNYLDFNILQFSKYSNMDAKNINLIDLSILAPSKEYYFRYIRKCVLVY